jgi:hypothetical protein
MNSRLLIASSLLVLAQLKGFNASAQAGGSSEPARAVARIEGHWTLTIRDENGAVASVHAFDNHFVGHWGFSRLLLGSLKANGWAFFLSIVDDQERTLQCLTPPPAIETDCWARQAEFRWPLGLPTLHVEGNTSIVLSGTVQSAETGILRAVSSFVGVCESGCYFGAITQRSLNEPSASGGPIPDPIVVKARQRIDVTLRITAR